MSSVNKVTIGSTFGKSGYAWPVEYLNFGITELCLVDSLGTRSKKMTFPVDFKNAARGSGVTVNGDPVFSEFHISLDQACQDPDFLNELYKMGTINADVNNISMIVGTVFSGVLMVVYVVQLIILLSQGTVQPIFNRPARGYYG